MKHSHAGVVLVLAGLLGGSAWAKLPALSDEAKAKAAEAAAKTAWSGKVDGFLLCKSQDRVAAQYLKTAKGAKAPAAAAPCADPGPFVYPPPTATATAAAAPAAAAAPGAKPAAPAAPAAKKS